jgi:hypothetical protein
MTDLLFEEAVGFTDQERLEILGGGQARPRLLEAAGGEASDVERGLVAPVAAPLLDPDLGERGAAEVELEAKVGDDGEVGAPIG